MNGIKAKKVMDGRKQVCAGYKIHKRKELFYKYYSNSTNIKESKFEKTSPVEYEAKTDVWYIIN